MSSASSARTSSGAAAAGRLTIPLDLKPALAHLRPDQHTTIRLEGVPEGAQLSAGKSDDNNVWSLTIAELDNLKVIAPAGFRGQSPLSVNLIRRDPEGGTAETISNFALLLTAEGAMSAFSGLEPEEKDSAPDSIVRLRSQVSKGRGLLSTKPAKKALDFGDGRAAFAAQRSSEHLNALLRGELAYNDGATSEASLQVEQRVALARKLWEGEAAQKQAAARKEWEAEVAGRLATARKEWDAERGQLTGKVQDLEGKLKQATNDLQKIHDERADWQGSVRTRLIDIVTKLNDEHAAELREIEQRLKNEADEMLAAARAEWMRKH
ncbi:MAG TPA: hypothetical protein VLV76_08835 [Candidatus Acidoferrum sp.]|nr:hypothetical protein [Candidatus Acidoferrum sp.]